MQVCSSVEVCKEGGQGQVRGPAEPPLRSCEPEGAWKQLETNRTQQRALTGANGLVNWLSSVRESKAQGGIQASNLNLLKGRGQGKKLKVLKQLITF